MYQPARVDRLRAAPLKQDCIETLSKTRAEIESSPFFKLDGQNVAAKTWWREWFTISMPPSYNTVSLTINLIVTLTLLIIMMLVNS